MTKLPVIPKVRNLESPRSGEPVKNQFVIEYGDFEIFQSYSTIIAIKGNGKIILDNSAYDYSITTSRYLNVFLSMKKADVLEHMSVMGNESTITMQDLNA